MKTHFLLLYFHIIIGLSQTVFFSTVTTFCRESKERRRERSEERGRVGVRVSQSEAKRKRKGKKRKKAKRIITVQQKATA